MRRTRAPQVIGCVGLAFVVIVGLAWSLDSVLSRLLKPTASQHLDERAPRWATLADRPDAAGYSAEVPDLDSSTVDRDSELAIPIDRALVRGHVWRVDRFASMWLIRTNEGHPKRTQHLYTFSDETGQLHEIVHLPPGMEVIEPFLFRTEQEDELQVVATMHPRVGYAPEHEEIWSFSLSTDEAARISNGDWLTPSPDRLRAAFLRSDGAGFHCYYWMDVVTGRVQPILSLWEFDPGSGPSFYCHWSRDSRVLRILGDGRGFRKRQGSRMEIDLVYFVAEDVMVSLN